MVVLQTFIKTAAVGGIALFWVNFTIESFKFAWHIIFTSPEKTLMAPLMAPFKSRVCNDDAVFKAVCGNCQEHYDDDEYHFINGSHLCEACR